MSQRLTAKTIHLPDKKSANVDKIIGLSNSCIVIRKMKFIKIFPETFFPKKFCQYHLQNENSSSSLGKEVDRGVLGTDMQVSLINDGPVTIIIDSRLKE